MGKQHDAKMKKLEERRIQQELEEKNRKINELLSLGRKFEGQSRWGDMARVYDQAIKLGSTEACCRMGWLHYNGTMYSGKNLSAAHTYFDTAAKNGDPEGFYGLYLVNRDRLHPESAEKCLRASAEKGYKPAISEYRTKYPTRTLDIKVKKTKKSDDAEHLYNEAMEWNERSFRTLMEKAESGNAKACYYLGLFIEQSGNSEEHMELCTKWYNISKDLGYKKSEGKLRQIAGYSRNKEDVCPACGKVLVIRPGNNGGYFKGCSGYPSCQYTTPVSTPYYGKKPTLTELGCFIDYKSRTLEQNK